VGRRSEEFSNIEEKELSTIEEISARRYQRGDISEEISAICILDLVYHRGDIAVVRTLLLTLLLEREKERGLYC